MATEERTGSLEAQLEAMLEIEKFEPPAEFQERALWSDPKVYEEAAADPEGWWLARARELLDWETEPSEALDESNPPFYKWFADGRLNASAQCLDRHVEAGRGERVAYHWRGEEGETRDITYAELHRDVKRFANALKDLGVGKGDVVGIYLPMIPEVVVAMLACARIGAPHNVVFGGFSAESVAERMDFSQAKALITVDGARRKGKTAPIKPSVDEHMAGIDSIETIVVVRHTQIECPMSEGRDVFYDEVLERAAEECPAEPMEAEHPLFILYTSGSTAKPKGILHTTGGYLTGVTATHRYVVLWASMLGPATGQCYRLADHLADEISAAFPGATITTLHQPFDLTPVLQSEGPVVVQGRDLGRVPQLTAAVADIRAARPDALIVELGWPDPSARGRPDVITYCGGRGTMLALLRALAERRR